MISEDRITSNLYSSMVCRSEFLTVPLLGPNSQTGALLALLEEGLIRGQLRYWVLGAGEYLEGSLVTGYLELENTWRAA